MQRYFISKEHINNQIITIVEEDVHHIKNVMRLSVGDVIVCCDCQGADYVSKIRTVTSTTVECEIIEKVSSRGEPKLRITIAQSLPKREKLEWVLQKGTEMGAVRFIPFQSERTIMRLDRKKIDHKLYRWKKIVKEAAEQAHRGIIPLVESPKSWEELLEEIQRTDTAFLAYEKRGAALFTRLSCTASSDILVIVGPEGGFTEKEVVEAQEVGATLISLGPRVLRTETASLVLLSGILYHSGDI